MKYTNHQKDVDKVIGVLIKKGATAIKVLPHVFGFTIDIKTNSKKRRLKK